MESMAEDPPHTPINRPPKFRLGSLCGTFLKPEMQSIYRQITGVQNCESIVFCEKHIHQEQFPHAPVIKLTKLTTPRAKGNFLLRFWYKYITRQWPPPVVINKLPPGPHFDYNLPKVLTEEKIDLVHVYYGHKGVKYLEMLRHWGGPFIVSFHGVDVSKYCDQPGYADSLKQVFAHAKLILARSESLLREIKSLGCPPEKLRLNRTPIPLDRLQATVRSAPTDGAWRVVQASRLIPKKGLLTTLQALALVVPKFPNLKFTVCGAGPMKDEFLQCRDKLGLQEHVTTRGWLSQEALLVEYQNSHVFLHPSELTKSSDQEGIPNSMLEAMATGLPVVATHHGGIPEAVTDGIDGLLVPEKSPQELAEAIIRLLSSQDMLGRLSKQAAESVRKNFGLESQIANLEACYAEALTGDKVTATT